MYCRTSKFETDFRMYCRTSSIPIVQNTIIPYFGDYTLYRTIWFQNHSYVCLLLDLLLSAVSGNMRGKWAIRRGAI